MKICVTGATGFLGSAVCRSAYRKNFEVVPLSRHSVSKHFKETLQQIDYGHVSKSIISKIKVCDALVHCAAQTNVLKTYSKNSDEEYRVANMDLTLQVAQLCIDAEIKRLIFISTSKVNGENSQPGKPFTACLSPNPENTYSKYKYKAEKALMEIGRKGDLEIVIIRPPLIYGPGVKANFAQLVNVVRRQIPIPFRQIENRRSLIAMENLVDFIFLCANRERSPDAANEIFLVSDDEDVSTPSLLKKVAAAYGVDIRLFPLPIFALKILLTLLGRRKHLHQLLGNHQIDISKAKDVLGWGPVITMDEQLQKMAKNSDA